jgi:DmsE family decaheme c-type cytochrome
MRMLKKIVKSRAGWLALILGLALISPGWAADKEDDEEEEKKPAKVRMTPEEQEAALEIVAQADFKGSDKCLSCHDEEYVEFPVFPLFRTKHAVVADPRSPFGGKGCESCHGPGGDHVGKVKKGERRKPIINFGKNAWTPVREQNEKCLDCHQTHQRIAWKGSTHAFNEVACATCHKVHVTHDPVLDRQAQPMVCFSCHANEQAKFYQISRHPVREGQMSCSECHDVHGENGSGLLVKAASREKCTSCHAEKRGPFFWEHAPAAEDCTLCHSAHGSNQPALLKKRPPQLCQACHSQAGHPSDRYDGNRRAGNAFMRAKSCLNCHSAVHGSNHPSGVTLLR